MTVRPLIRNARIMGTHFRKPEEKAIHNNLKRGDEVTLALEPTNEFDEFAVKILKDGAHIGYVPKEMSALFHILDVDQCTVAITTAEGKDRLFSVGVPE